MSREADQEESVPVNGRVVATIIIIMCAIASGPLTGCASHSCSQVGYICEQTQITLQSPNDAWTPGTYTLTLIPNGAPAQCTISVAASPSSNGVAGSCPVGASYALELTPVESCPPVVCHGGACHGMSCTPIAGHFQM